METDINLNNTTCIVKTNNFTETVATNVCSGEVVEVPYGTLDLAVGITLVLLMVGIFTIIGGVFYKLVTY